MILVNDRFQCGQVAVTANFTLSLCYRALRGPAYLRCSSFLSGLNLPKQYMFIDMKNCIFDLRTILLLFPVGLYHYHLRKELPS